jgi:hypothetical protein
MEDEYDPRNYSAQRANAVRFLEHVRDIIGSSLRYKGLTRADRKVLKSAERNLYCSFEQLDKSFVAPLADKQPSLATFGYETLWLMMSASFYAGSRGTITGSAKAFIKMDLRRAQQAERGRRSGVSRRAKRRWPPHAGELAIQIRKGDSSASASTIADEILSRWKVEDIFPPSHDTLAEYVRSMIKSGALAPARTKNAGANLGSALART